jgi:hypothetical protein
LTIRSGRVRPAKIEASDSEEEDGFRPVTEADPLGDKTCSALMEADGLRVATPPDGTEAKAAAFIPNTGANNRSTNKAVCSSNWHASCNLGMQELGLITEPQRFQEGRTKPLILTLAIKVIAAHATRG